jgi:hypothetical protein
MRRQEKLAAAARDLLKAQSNREQRAVAAQSRKRLMLSSGSAAATIQKVLAMPAMSGELWRRECGSPSRELHVTRAIDFGSRDTYAEAVDFEQGDALP